MSYPKKGTSVNTELSTLPLISCFKNISHKNKQTKITPLSKKQNKIITGACFALEVYIC